LLVVHGAGSGLVGQAGQIRKGIWFFWVEI